jgi:hypothetical protein
MLDDLGKLFEATWIDIPAAAAKRLMAGEDEGAMREAGWKAYDAFVRLSNEASNFLYTNRTFGEMAGRGIGLALRAQRVGDAVASAVFGNLWPAIGLPTGSEVQALRSDVRTLREEVRAARGGAPSERFEERHRIEDGGDRATIDRNHVAAHAAEARSGTMAMIWSGYKPAAPHKARRGKGSVAL